jgi:sulfatase modifying factor 1
MGNSPNRSQSVGQLRPNDLGLFDVHGNAWEWTQDAFRDQNYIGDIVDIRDAIRKIDGGVSRVLRGGSFNYRASSVRSARRIDNVPASRNYFNGFRPARTLPLGTFTALPLPPKGDEK